MAPLETILGDPQWKPPFFQHQTRVFGWVIPLGQGCEWKHIIVSRCPRSYPFCRVSCILQFCYCSWFFDQFVRTTLQSPLHLVIKCRSGSRSFLKTILQTSQNISKQSYSGMLPVSILQNQSTRSRAARLFLLVIRGLPREMGLVVVPPTEPNTEITSS